MANDAATDKPSTDKPKAKSTKPTHLRVRVRARGQESFRRAGLTFGQQAMDVPLADLSEDRIKAICAEKALVAELVVLD